MKNWSLVFILAISLLCLSVCRTQAETPASSGNKVEKQTAEPNEDAQEAAEDAKEEKEDLAEAQKDAQEALQDAQKDAEEEAKDARKDALEAQKDMQEKEARKGLLEAQKEMRNAGINIDLPGIVGTSLGMFAATNAAEKAGAVLIVPDKPTNAKTMGELTEDMQVMAVVLEDKIGQNKTAGAQGYGAGGYGRSGGISLNIFGSSSPQPRAVYLGGYGMMFTMDVDFPLVLIKGAEEKTQAPAQEKKDEVWQRGKDKLKGKDKPADKNKGKDKEPALVFDLEKVKQLQKDLTAALKHASNIRNLEPREKIIVVVRSVIDGEVLSLAVPETAGAQEKEPVSIPTSIMTLRADKQDIDAFAAEKINFDRFAEKVSVVIY
jgi:hypothetical protein